MNNAESGAGGWWPIIREPYDGAWQRGDSLTNESVLAFHAVYACITLIAADIGKLPAETLVTDSKGDIWNKNRSHRYSALLNKPNRYQTWQQFAEWWQSSKLSTGNAYILKVRDEQGIVVAMHILDPAKVKVLVSPMGMVFYELQTDNISGLEDLITVPASEIMHDRICPLYHPLVGVSPLYAARLAADHGLRIQEDSRLFYRNGSNPGGVLTAPGSIADQTATRIKNYWDNNFTGSNSGKVAVLGDGLKFEPLRMRADEAQSLENLKWTAEIVCGVFHVPPYKIAAAATPSYNNIEALGLEYYVQCLQPHIEAMEAILNDGLGMDRLREKIQMNIEPLQRMDTATQIDTLVKGVGGGVIAPNEARQKQNLAPKPGGDSPYMQQQNFSLEALARRDAQADPFSPDDSQNDNEGDINIDDMAMALVNAFRAKPLRISHGLG